jgi:octaheme c-type cytochrome (tetrathionate reductase family)
MRNLLQNKKYYWVFGLLLIFAVIGAAIWFLMPPAGDAAGDPRSFVPVRPPHTEHTDLMYGPYATGQEVTQACLECHPDAAQDVMHTSHFTWESKPVAAPWLDNQLVTIGKKNQINNFCIGTQGNEKKCMSCHAGYGWTDAGYDFENPLNVDCLACHADPGKYTKGEYGNPMPETDLAAAAQSVRTPDRENCGKCHFNGGGGNGVKHGDLDESLYFPKSSLDVHMGEHNLLCVDCHTTQDHQVKGRLLADNLTIDPQEQVACSDCHQGEFHTDERINLHTQSVACQTCHVPAFALKDPTKMTWDWSTAGQDIPDDHFTYLKIKGSFTYEEDVKPAYEWFNGSNAYRYLLGDKIDPSKPTMINVPAGDINDPTAKIFPFKVHVARQPFDTVYNYLLQPRTGGGGNGDGGFWETFDWVTALELGAQDTNMQFSGQYGFAETWMYWPSTHMVQAKENALQCDDCHSADGRLDWEALGYPGDPLEWGSRSTPAPQAGQ